MVWKDKLKEKRRNFSFSLYIKYLSMVTLRKREKEKKRKREKEKKRKREKEKKRKREKEKKRKREKSLFLFFSFF
ncbi:hypothetical protein [Enterococcus faecalis]